MAAADYLIQYRHWYKPLKMTLHELKEEFKQTEGDPVIRSKMKQARQTRQRKPMMATVSKATVVITNPTHYAVTLHYEHYEHDMDTPVRVANGIDQLAPKICDIVGEHSVPVVENAPHARALHATAAIDQAIQPEHYKAVAEVISYVMRLRCAVPPQFGRD